VVVNEDRLDLDCAEEYMVLDGSVVDVECDDRFLRCNVAGVLVSRQKKKGTLCGDLQRHLMFPHGVMGRESAEERPRCGDGRRGFP
jgi:hypothetical protein